MGLVPGVAKVSLASLVGGAVAFVLSRALDNVLVTGTALGSLLALVITGIVGLAVIMLLCRVFHVGEINRLFSAIKRKVLRR